MRRLIAILLGLAVAGCGMKPLEEQTKKSDGNIIGKTTQAVGVIVAPAPSGGVGGLAIVERDAGKGDTRLFVRDAGRIVPIKVSSIEHLEACDDYVLVYTANQRYRINVTLTELEERLDLRTFVRVHRSHMVNLDHVASWTPYDGARVQITLKSGATIMASRQRSRELRTLGR